LADGGSGSVAREHGGIGDWAAAVTRWARVSRPRDRPHARGLRRRQRGCRLSAQRQHTCHTVIQPCRRHPGPSDHDSDAGCERCPREYRLQRLLATVSAAAACPRLSLHAVRARGYRGDVQAVSKADEENFIVVYPDGKGRRFTSGDDVFVEPPRRVESTGAPSSAGLPPASRTVHQWRFVSGPTRGRFAHRAPVSAAPWTRRRAAPGSRRPASP
jgi:hypothetical protein